MRIIEVVPHRTEWAAEFRAESSRLRAVFLDRAHAIHHIGSTAVAGLAAKPVIDILVVVDSTADIDEFSASMEHLGYTVRGECLDAEVPGSPGRFYFSKDVVGRRTHHVHVCQAGHAEISDLLLLRDYLRSNFDQAAHYGRVKARSAVQHRVGSVGYMRAKAETVRTLLADARIWGASQ